MLRQFLRRHASTSSSTTISTSSARRNLPSLTLHTILNAGIVLSAVIFLNDNVYETTRITGSSMSPSLSPLYKTHGLSDWILWSKYQPAVLANLRRGDLVLFRKPHDPEVTAVKRVVALGGDTVILDPRRRPREVVNGRLSEESRKWALWDGKVVVPEGHVWVEGDGWRESLDSHSYGPVSLGLVLGRAVCVMWPWGRAGTRPWEGWKGVQGRKTIVIEPGKSLRVVDAEEAKSKATWKGYGEGG